jgi:hypothetical protein
MSVSRTNSFDLAGGSGRPTSSTQLSVTLFADPWVPVVGLGYPRLSALEDVDGKALPVGSGSFLSGTEPIRSGTAGVFRPIFLNLPAKYEGSLKRLAAVLPFEVEVRRRERAVVTGMEGANSKTVPIAGGGRLTVQTRRSPGSFGTVEVRVETAGLWTIDSRRHAVELVDDAGVRYRGDAIFQFSAPGDFAPESLLAGGHPLADLAWQVRLQSPGTRGRAMLNVPPSAVLGAKSRLIFYDADRLRTEATFELRDLPLQ